MTKVVSNFLPIYLSTRVFWLMTHSIGVKEGDWSHLRSTHIWAWINDHPDQSLESIAPKNNRHSSNAVPSSWIKYILHTTIIPLSDQGGIVMQGYQAFFKTREIPLQPPVEPEVIIYLVTFPWQWRFLLFPNEFQYDGIYWIKSVMTDGRLLRLSIPNDFFWYTLCRSYLSTSTWTTMGIPPIPGRLLLAFRIASFVFSLTSIALSAASIQLTKNVPRPATGDNILLIIASSL